MHLINSFNRSKKIIKTIFVDLFQMPSASSRGEYNHRLSGITKVVDNQRTHIFRTIAHEKKQVLPRQ